MAEAAPFFPEVARLDYTLVLRSLDRFYGAAGIGLGFAITTHPIAGRLRAALGSAPVSAQALAFGLAALADADWLQSQRARLKIAAAGLDAVLAAAGLRSPDGPALFRAAATPSAGELFVRLASQGILTRPFPDASLLRFGFPKDDDELARVGRALTPSAA